MALASSRRCRGVTWDRYRVGPRRIICKGCWDELDDERAAPNTRGNPSRWCKACFRQANTERKRRRRRDPAYRVLINARRRAAYARNSEKERADTRARYWRKKLEQVA